MIITPKIQGTGVLFSLGRRTAPWLVAFAAGSLFLACSGTIDTPTDEYPSRGNNAAPADDDDDTAAADDDDAPPAPRPQAPAAEDDDEDPPAQPAADDDEEPPVDDEEPPAEEEPPVEEEPAPSGGVTFEADVFPILSVACAPCHAGGGAGGNNVGDPDVETAFAEASRVADRVIDRIENGGMPLGCGGPPGSGGTCVSEEDFATIQAWVEAGTPE